MNLKVYFIKFTFGMYSKSYFYSVFSNNSLSLSTSYNLVKILTTSKLL